MTTLNVSGAVEEASRCLADCETLVGRGLSLLHRLPRQLELAKASKENIKRTKPFSDNIVTPVLEAATFYDAEDYHQDYYKKNPIKYRYYRTGCGRDKRLKKLWGNK